MSYGKQDTGGSAAKALAALGKSIVVAGAKRVYHIKAYNDNASTRYLQLHDAAALPADTAVPVISIPIATQAAGEIAWQLGRPLQNGLVAAISSTDVTLTITATDDALIDLTYD